MGGLALAQPQEESPLSSVVMNEERDPYYDAIVKLRQQGANLEPDSSWQVARNAGAAPPSTREVMQREEIKRRNEAILAEKAAIDARARAELGRPMTNEWLPFIRTMAGAMRPTRTGSLGESMGQGLEGLATGLADNEKAVLDFQQKRAALESRVGHETATLKQHGLGQELNADQIAAQMALAQKRMQQSLYNTPAIREWMVTNRLTIDDIEKQNYTEAQRQELNKLILLARGSTANKDALAVSGLGSLNPGNPQFAQLASVYANQKMVTKAWDQADKIVPRSQFIGRPPEEYEQARTAAFHKILQSYVAAPLGAPGSPAAPASGGAAAPAAAPPAASPGPSAPAAGAVKSPLAPGAEAPRNFVDYVTGRAKAWSQNPNIIQDEHSRQKMDAIALQDWQEHVLPGVHSGEALVSAASTLDQLDPYVGPISGLVEGLGKVGSVLGLPDNNRLVSAAANISTASKVVEELRNGIMLKAKGVQTEGDAQRALQQIANLKDVREAFEAAKAYMRGIGQRHIDKGEFYNNYAEMNAGQATGANTEWARNAMGIPLFVRVKFADGKPGFLTYKEFIEQHVKAGETVEQAIQALKAKAYK